jgi:hypothetical protein
MAGFVKTNTFYPSNFSILQNTLAAGKNKIPLKITAPSRENIAAGVADNDGTGHPPVMNTAAARAGHKNRRAPSPAKPGFL